ncbi:MAG TPA: (d)CMP kinase [Smithellaceae bacterium]|nr:(d)CMP kinase [Smithellaceae bacterium]HRS82377.1 (d)CMP kinase [Smithellaceae bacterium]HRV44939.1 (d)CMP kinase [Smithellaceae bacterium]
MTKKVITIDGPAGAGKSTVSKALADRLQYLYLDTGALYRALAFKALKKNMDVNHPGELAELCSTTEVALQKVNGNMTVLVDGEDVGEKIRTEEVGLAASTISAFAVVREKLLSLQREAGAGGGIVAEGRDMGSVVFPNADFKFYLDADLEERIRRRCGELASKTGEAEHSAVSRDMRARDAQDTNRKIAPLAAAPDAVIIDSTSLTIPQVVEKILEHLSRASASDNR